jgi:hypothetical protein
LNIPYFECSSNSGEGLNSVFRGAVRSVLYSTITKESISFKQLKCKEFPYFYMSPGSRGKFTPKYIPSSSTLATSNPDIWSMKYTEEGDQVRITYNNQ